MPVWGVWDGDSLWFSSSGRSRKTANLRRDPRCVLTNDDAVDPVIVEGSTEIVTEAEGIRGFLDLLNAKCETDYGVDFLDPEDGLHGAGHSAFGVRSRAGRLQRVADPLDLRRMRVSGHG